MLPHNSYLWFDKYDHTYKKKLFSKLWLKQKLFTQVMVTGSFQDANRTLASLMTKHIILSKNQPSECLICDIHTQMTIFIKKNP